MRRTRTIIVLLVIVCLVAGSASEAAETVWESDSKLSIHCLDMGQGDCTLIISPTGDGSMPRTW